MQTTGLLKSCNGHYQLILRWCHSWVCDEWRQMSRQGNDAEWVPEKSGTELHNFNGSRSLLYLAMKQSKTNILNKNNTGNAFRQNYHWKDDTFLNQLFFDPYQKSFFVYFPVLSFWPINEVSVFFFVTFMVYK
jgi:hypothetical protein